MKVIFQNAGNLHMKRDLRDARSATRPDPGRGTMGISFEPQLEPFSETLLGNENLLSQQSTLTVFYMDLCMNLCMDLCVGLCMNLCMDL